MQARYHAISGGVAASLLIPVLGVNSIFFFASSILIDGDHYLDYVYRNGFKDFSVRRMFAFHEHLFKKASVRNLLALNIMHTVEFLLLMHAASVITDWVWLKAALWGILFHMAFDLIYLYIKGRFIHRSFSVVDYLVRWNRRKRQGLNPELPYQSALKAISVRPVVSEDEGVEAEREH
ncbi:hypothetical protein ACFLU9_00390 [Chloroflexota bacterium]